jgi:hypothetical protein
VPGLQQIAAEPVGRDLRRARSTSSVASRSSTKATPLIASACTRSRCCSAISRPPVRRRPGRRCPPDRVLQRVERGVDPLERRR